MLLLVACAVSDTERFVQATEATDLPTAHAACAAIEDGELRGECAAHVVREHAVAQPTASRATCELGTDSWRDECVFLWAEELHSPADPEATAARCRDAGRYAVSCLMHVWSGHAGSLKREHGLTEAAALYAPALDWAGDVATDDTAHRAWSLFYRTELDPTVPLDEAACAALPGDHPRFCRKGLQEALSRAIHRVSREAPGTFVDACAADDSAGRAEAIGRVAVAYVPSPAMDAVAKRAIAADCRLDEGP